MFQRQVKIGDAWMPESALEWRNVDLCDGCGGILGEGLDFAFKADIFTDSQFANQPVLTVHMARDCAEQAILKRAAPLLNQQRWPV